MEKKSSNYQYNKKYAEEYLKQFENINIRAPKGTREQWKKHAESKGMSLTALITDLIEKDIERAKND